MKKIEVKVIPALIVSIVIIAIVIASSMIYEHYKKYNPADYITLGDYKNVKSDLSLNVSDREVDNEIFKIMKNYASDYPDDHLAQIGDMVSVDYFGDIVGDTEDDSGFHDVTGSNEDFVLDGTNSKQFEDNLKGTKIGDVKKFTITYPTDYSDTALAGKTVAFEITVNKIKKIPELDDNYAFMIADINSAEQYRQKIKDDIATNKLYDIKSDLWKTVCSEAMVKEYPKDRLKLEIAEQKKPYEQKATEAEYTDVYEYVYANYQMTKSAFDEEMEITAMAVMKNDMVIDAICEREKITVTDELYNKWVDYYVEYYEGEYTKETIVQKFDNSDEELREQILWELVMEKIMETATWQK